MIIIVIIRSCMFNSSCCLCLNTNNMICLLVCSLSYPRLEPAEEAAAEPGDGDLADGALERRVDLGCDKWGQH